MVRPPPSSIGRILLAIGLPALSSAVCVSAHVADLPRDGVATAFFVSSEGRSDAAGTRADPWDLATALAHPQGVRPGDTIWLLGGVYRGTFRSDLRGVQENPVIVRSVPRERVVIDGGDSGGRTILVVGGEHVWYWGLEITSSTGGRRSSTPGPSPPDVRYGEAIAIDQSAPHPGLRFINMVIHDTRQGIGWWQEATDSEIYGSLIFYNGWQGPDDGHGHGIYGQNESSIRRIVDSIVFDQFGEGIQIYGSAKVQLNNFLLRGNTLFRNGILSGDFTRNVLIGGSNPAESPELSSNYLYYAPGGPATALKLGYPEAECVRPILKDNFIANNVMLSCTSMHIDGNTFYGWIAGFSSSQFPANTYLSARPTGVNIFLRPNRYEPGRANITIFNWDLKPAVDVDLSGILAPGDRFEIRNVQDFFGEPVVAGTYENGAVSIPMAGLTVAAPVGWPAPPPTGPEFNAFVLITTDPARRGPQSAAPDPREPRTVERPSGR